MSLVCLCMLHRSGAQLHLGAHDYFPTTASEMNGQTVQTRVLEGRGSFAPETYALLTVIVNSSHVAFYRDIELLGTKRLPRVVTDCFNNQAGVLVGDVDMDLGQLRFYPRALTFANVEEIYAFGSTLGDISTVGFFLASFALLSTRRRGDSGCAWLHRICNYML